LRQLHEVPDNLLPSNVIPRAVNGSVMRPIGKIPVTIALETSKHTEDLHIYPDVDRILLSWKAARGLNILPECYPRPIKAPRMAMVQEQTPPGGTSRMTSRL
jgi:hypothetical protein